MKEIILTLPHPVMTDEIKLVLSEEIEAHYKAKGQNTPFQWVLIPYVEIDGKDYAVLVKEGSMPGTPERWNMALAFAQKVKEKFSSVDVDPGDFFRLVVDLIDRV